MKESKYGVLGIRTRGRRTEGAYESTVLAFRFLVIQVSISCICKSLYLLFSAFYYFLALNYLSFPLRQAFPIRFTFAPFAPLSVHLTYTPHFMYFYFCFLQSSSARLSLQDVFHL